MRPDAYPAHEPFREEYTPAFVSRWDELINWEGRRRSEHGFFERILNENGVRKVLDIACGTGYHTITLTQSGFDVIGADGAASMIAEAKNNTLLYGLEDLQLVESDWGTLSLNIPSDSRFDAVICLGNAFTHLLEEEQRIQTLKEVYTLLNPGGIAIIDQRNYDSLLDRGFSSKHKYYYVGDTVDVKPSFVRDDLIRLEYTYSDGAVHHLTVFPLRQDHLTRLLKYVGFQQVDRYGDFQEDYEFYDPDFIVQVATKV